MSKEEVRKIINESTDSIYIGDFDVVEEDGFFSLLLYLHHDKTVPIVMSIEGSEEDFIKFIKNELKNKRFGEIQFSKLVKSEID